jgi:HEAT repeat protein
MVNPDDLMLMTDQEKLDLLRQIADAEEWQACFEPIYRRLMDDECPQVRQEAIAGLWELADPRHIEPLVRKAQHDPDVDVRAKAASVLGIYIYETISNGMLEEAEFLSIRGLLLDLAQDAKENLVVRRMAIEALSFDNDELIQDLIEWAYGHPNKEVRMSAIFAMGRSRSSRWTDAILHELDSDERELQIEAVNASAESGLEQATPRLRNLAASPDKDLRMAAIWALSQTRGPGALETIEMCTQAEDEEVRNLAHEALEELYHAEREDDEIEDDEDEPDDYRN